MKHQFQNSGRLEEGHRLYSGDFKALPATDVLAGDHVVSAHHVGLCFREAGAVTLVGIAGKSVFLVTNQPPKLIIGGLSAVRAGERVITLLGPLVEKFPFFHV